MSSRPSGRCWKYSWPQWAHTGRSTMGASGSVATYAAAGRGPVPRLRHERRQGAVGGHDHVTGADPVERLARRPCERSIVSSPGAATGARTAVPSQIRAPASLRGARQEPDPARGLERPVVPREAAGKPRSAQRLRQLARDELEPGSHRRARAATCPRSMLQLLR